MRAEMNEVLGPDPNAVPDYDQILKLKYCLAVFSEALRIHSNVPLNFKMTMTDTVLPGTKTQVYAGQRIFFHTYAMGQSEKIWGSDAEEFKPQRWLDEKGSVRKEDQYKFPMFNAGPRICLGMDSECSTDGFECLETNERADFALLCFALPRSFAPHPVAKQEAMVLLCATVRKFRLKVVREDDPQKWGDFAGRRGRYDLGATLGVRKSLDVQVVPV